MRYVGPFCFHSQENSSESELMCSLWLDLLISYVTDLAFGTVCVNVNNDRSSHVVDISAEKFTQNCSLT